MWYRYSTEPPRPGDGSRLMNKAQYFRNVILNDITCDISFGRTGPVVLHPGPGPVGLSGRGCWVGMAQLQHRAAQL